MRWSDWSDRMVGLKFACTGNVMFFDTVSGSLSVIRFWVGDSSLAAFGTLYLKTGVTSPLPVAVHATCCAEFVVVPPIVFVPVWSNTAGPFRVAVYWTPAM